MSHDDMMLFAIIVAGIVAAAIVIDIVQMLENAAGIKAPQLSL